MATIRYTFADGHTEEVEVTEEFKREYEFLLVREQAPHWKEMKQKERAGLRCVKNLSLDKFSEDGYDLPVAGPDPLERLIQKEERREYCRKILSCLSEKQRQAYKSITLDCFVTFDNINGRLFEVRKIIHNLTFLAAQNLLFFRFHFLTPRNQEIFSHFSHFFPRLGQALPREIRKIVFIEKCLMSYGVYAISLLPLFIKIFPVFPIFPIF